MPHSKAYIKLKKEIKELSDYNRGLYTSFWLGYIHGIHDYSKYGKITEEEGMELEDLILKGNDKKGGKLWA